MEYNVANNRVETNIKVVINAMKAEREERENNIRLAAEGISGQNYKKIYGEKECVEFEIEMFKRGIKLSTSLLSKDEKGMYKEFAWCE